MKKLIKKIRFRRCVSMKVPLLFCFLLVTLVPLLVQARFLAGFFRQSQIEDSMIEAQSKCLMLTNKMITLDYINNMSNNPGLDAEMNVTADLFNGRIVVIDSSFKIIKDTFELTKGKTSVVEEVLRSFEGETINRRNKEKDYFYLTLPVYSKADSQKVEGVLLMTASTESMALLESQVMHKAGFLQFVLFLFVAVIDLLAASFLMKPFKKLQERLNMVSEGNLDQDIQVDDYKETRGISNAVSQTLRKLKAVDQSRQEFVSNVSHELKTPLTSMKVLADSLLAQEDVPVELYQEFMGDIAEEIERENKIINDLLSLVKMDKTTMNLTVQPENINELVERILKRLRPIAAQRNIELVFESFRPVTAEVDEVKLTLALSNLVENAIKYNRDDGWVHVSLNADHKYFYVKVADSGIGIPKEDTEHIFERFYRVDKARSKKTGGTGLGLAIVKHIVQYYKGTIHLESELGKGTTFKVVLPIIKDSL